MSDTATAQLSQLLVDQRFDEACQLIVQTLGPELRGYLRGAMGNEQDGDDLYGDLCLALCERLPSFQQRSSVRTWLYAIAHHLVWKRLERYSRRHVVRLNTDEAGRLPAAGRTSLQERTAREQGLAQIDQQLTPEERELLILHTERDFSFRQIGQILQISEPAAKQRFHRLRERLKELAERSQGER